MKLPWFVLGLLGAGCSRPPVVAPTPPAAVATATPLAPPAKPKVARPTDVGDKAGYSRSANFPAASDQGVEQTVVERGHALRKRVVKDPSSGLTVSLPLP